jgi:hypothetical protein
MKSIETQKLGYVAYPVIVDEIQQLAESVIDLSDEDFSSRRELLLKEGINVNRFPLGEKPNLISIKIYNESKYVSLIETVRDLESYEIDVDKFWKTITEEFQNHIKESKHKLALSNVIYSSEVSVNANYIARAVYSITTKENFNDSSCFSEYAENKDDVPPTDKPDKPTGGLIFTFEFIDEITALALHDYHWVFDKWDSATEKEKDDSINNPVITNNNLCSSFYVHYPQISNTSLTSVKNFVVVRFDFADPRLAVPIPLQTQQSSDDAYQSRLVFYRLKAFFDKNATTYDNNKELTDSIRKKYINVFKSFGKDLLFLTKHHVISYENRSYAEMIFTCC